MENKYKLGVSLRYKGEFYKSELDEYTEKEEAKLIDHVNKAMKGDLHFFCIRSGKDHFHFPEKVLAESIISIIKVDI